jgi:hypothetical protein
MPSIIRRFILGARLPNTFLYGGEKMMGKRLSEERRRKVEEVAAVLWLLPAKLRYRFFSAFHPDLYRFFSEEREAVGDAVVTVGVSGTMQVRWAGKRAEAELSFGLPPARFKLRLGRSGRFQVQVQNEGVVEALVAVVKGLKRAERDYLWGLMDEALADYEDHLLATDPKLLREQEEALAEIEQGNYITLTDLTVPPE